MVASGVGKPLYQDAITKTYARIDFARVCVMVDFDNVLPKHIIVMALTNREEAGRHCRVDRH